VRRGVVSLRELRLGIGEVEQSQGAVGALGGARYPGTHDTARGWGRRCGEEAKTCYNWAGSTRSARFIFVEREMPVGNWCASRLGQWGGVARGWQPRPTWSGEQEQSTSLSGHLSRLAGQDAGCWDTVTQITLSALSSGW
jgi:hypothetical protein